MTKPKAYSYSRFSTLEQMKGDSLRRQTQLAERYAVRHGLELDTELTFHDLGRSAYRGSNLQTGQLGAFMQAIDEGYVEEGSYLLVESLDRLSRDKVRRARNAFEAIIERGINIVTLQDERCYTLENIDGDPTNLLLSVLTMIRAHEESLVKSQRLSAVWGEKKKRAAEGKVLTARTPAWIAKDPESQKLELIPERAEIIKRIYRETLTGKGQHAIAIGFNTEGLPTWGRGEVWHRSYIKKILENIAVTGVYQPYTRRHSETSSKRVPDGEPIPDYYPRVIEDDTYYQVQAMKKSSASPLRGRHAKNSVSHMLAGLAKCSKCESTMTRVNKGKKARPKLVCTKAKAGGGCDYISVDQEDIEESIKRHWPKFLEDFPYNEEGEKYAEIAAGLEAHLSDVEAEIEGLTRAIARRDSDTLRDKLSEREQQHSKAQAELEDALDKQYQYSSHIAQKRLAKFEEMLDVPSSSVGEFNGFLRSMFTKAVIDPRGKSLRFHWEFADATTAMLFGWPNDD